MIVGEKLVRERKKAGFTQKDLGDAIGVSQATIGRWEHMSTLDLSTLENIADALKITLQQLLSEESLYTGECFQEVHEDDMTIYLKTQAGYKLLALCLIEENRVSYIQALRDLEADKSNYEAWLECRLCEEFFKIDFPGFLETEVDGDAVIRNLKKYAKSNKKIKKIYFDVREKPQEKSNIEQEEYAW